tara:strand:- start:1877 stop:2023 length:147 start_codon:yes stop_codon:yes gene_type:complete
VRDDKLGIYSDVHELIEKRTVGKSKYAQFWMLKNQPTETPARITGNSL